MNFECEIWSYVEGCLKLYEDQRYSYDERMIECFIRVKKFLDWASKDPQRSLIMTSPDENIRRLAELFK